MNERIFFLQHFAKVLGEENRSSVGSRVSGDAGRNHTILAVQGHEIKVEALDEHPLLLSSLAQGEKRRARAENPSTAQALVALVEHSILNSTKKKQSKLIN